MPLRNENDYHPPFPFTSSHFSTVYPTLLRGMDELPYLREELTTPDGDFIHVDWLKNSRSNLVIICHGLEGSSSSKYAAGMAKMFGERGWSVAAMNFRGCSGVPNRLPSFYHSGLTQDLNLVVADALEKDYRRIALVGFSLGGNLVLKYLGEKLFEEAERVTRAAVFSVPVDLKDSSVQLKKRKNYIYTKRFLLKLGKKLKAKKELFPEKMDLEPLKNIKNLMEFDDLYTAPLHGFQDAEDYYAKNSSKQYLGGISVPVLLANAKNDPFLGPECYPEEIAASHKFLELMIPEYGGHVGFYQPGGVYFSEKAAYDFIAGE
jgi:predicted alpha/beta-fold hydrolase